MSRSGAVRLGELSVVDARSVVEHGICASARLLRGEWLALTFIPDARGRYVTWSGLRIQDARQHFRRRAVVPSEAELNHLCLEHTGEPVRAMSCVRCRSTVGTGHLRPWSSARQLPDGSEIATCTVMEGALSYALFDMGRLIDDRVARSGFTEDGWLRSPVTVEEVRESISRAIAVWAPAPGGREAVALLLRQRGEELGIAA